LLWYQAAFHRITLHTGEDSTMSEYTRTNRAADCDVCGVAHDEEIHEATLSVHRWFQAQVTRYLYEYEEERPAVQVA
jgi:hypothetical protein